MGPKYNTREMLIILPNAELFTASELPRTEGGKGEGGNR